MVFRTALRAVPCLAALALGCGKQSAAPPAQVAAANPYLETIVHEVLGQAEPVLCLSGPGMCPGHFDVRPSQIDRLRSCRVLLRFDFQASLDAKLSPLVEEGLRVVPARPTGGLCIPDTYVSIARQVADGLVDAGLVRRDRALQKLADLEKRLAATGRQARKQVADAGLSGTTVLASGHQAGFCRWLGLGVSGAFSSSDRASVGELGQAVRAGEASAVRFVVANRPEGRNAADALADRLAATVVVFDNFPDTTAGHRNFEDLLRANVEALLAAAKR